MQTNFLLFHWIEKNAIHARFTLCTLRGKIQRERGRANPHYLTWRVQFCVLFNGFELFRCGPGLFSYALLFKYWLVTCSTQVTVWTKQRLIVRWILEVLMKFKSRYGVTHKTPLRFKMAFAKCRPIFSICYCKNDSDLDAYFDTLFKSFRATAAAQKSLVLLSNSVYMLLCLCNYDTGSGVSSIWRLGRRWWHNEFSEWQLMVPPVATVLSGWWPFVFGVIHVNCE